MTSLETELTAAIVELLHADKLSTADCYTDGYPNENWGAGDRAKEKIRDILTRMGVDLPV